MQLPNDLGGAARHGHDGRAAVGRGCQCGAVLTGSSSHLVSTDVGADVDVEASVQVAAAHAGIDERHLAAGRDDAIAQVAQLCTLGVECPQQHHDRHAHALPVSG